MAGAYSFAGDTWKGTEQKREIDGALINKCADNLGDARPYGNEVEAAHYFKPGRRPVSLP